MNDLSSFEGVKYRLDIDKQIFWNDVAFIMYVLLGRAKFWLVWICHSPWPWKEMIFEQKQVMQFIGIGSKILALFQLPEWLIYVTSINKKFYGKSVPKDSNIYNFCFS